MKIALDDITRFANLLTRNPTTDELLLTLLRDYLSRFDVIGMEVQLFGVSENLELRHFVGVPIEGPAVKTAASISRLVADESIYSDLAKFGSIYNSINHVSLTAININSSVKGFYIFEHGIGYTATPESGHYLEALSSLLTIYLIGKTKAGGVTSFLGAQIQTELTSGLNPRQLLIIAGMIDGKTNHELSLSLGFSVSTIRHETMAIFKALGVSDRKEAGKEALLRGLL